jgi:hypothetical protein
MGPKKKKKKHKGTYSNANGGAPENGDACQSGRGKGINKQLHILFVLVLYCIYNAQIEIKLIA